MDRKRERERERERGWEGREVCVSVCEIEKNEKKCEREGIWERDRVREGRVKKCMRYIERGKNERGEWKWV